MIESLYELKRREFAIKVAEDIQQHPAYPFSDGFPRAMVVLIDRALEAWKKQKHG